MSQLQLSLLRLIRLLVNMCIAVCRTIDMADRGVAKVCVWLVRVISESCNSAKINLWAVM